MFLTDIAKVFPGIGKKKQYRISNIKNLGINHTYSATVFKMNSRNSEKNYKGNMNQGKIQFDYGMKTIKLGQSIEEAEARHIISLFRENRHFSEENFVSE
ncbi:MAG: hypothetical protein DWQ02_17845 [Bacteroidetes bacterium]|nr:MAG: hypothetical protein DWQ02_17845 [Bacteroidota bacterium]